ncbi:SDR family NAD(P)-dependent oxidoreductase [Candidatus Pelagibacter sp.]|nr:SDR family NAD(P)-dependent oxidoreductase [Candidatus Pelagibacter sp.]
MKKIIIIGSNSSLAQSIIKLLEKSKFSIFKISRREINFEKKNSKLKLNSYLKRINPNIIVNCVGVFKNNNFNFESMFKINTKVSWDLIDYYRKNEQQNVKIFVIGSSAHNKTRKNYILYVSSKSALNSMVKSAKELFLKTNIEINIINPPAMRSNMRDKFFKVNKLQKKKTKMEIDPIVIAKKIIRTF